MLNIIAKRKQRWIDFYNPAKPPVCLFWMHCYPDLGARPWPYPDRTADRIAWSWRKYQTQVQQMEWLEDDSLPFLDIYTGTELFAEAFGCQVHYPGNDMPFALPLVHTPQEADRLVVPRLDNPAFARVFEIARELRRRAGSAALVRLPDIQSPMDIAALIWEKTAFYPALLEYPSAVLELAGKINSLLTSFLDAWFAEFGSEFIAHYPDYYVPRGITLSEDEVGVVSPAVFERFFLPELSALSRRYGAIGMHCCANSRHQWSNFLQIPNLILLNLIQPVKVLREAYPFFEQFAAQMHGWYGTGPAWTWPAQHPAGRRIIYDLSADTLDQAQEMLEKLTPYRSFSED